MANYGVRFSATVVDGLSTEASVLSYIYEADTETIAQLVTLLDAWVVAVDGLTDGVITRNAMTIVPPNASGIKTTGTTTTTYQASRVEQTAVFNFKTASSSKRWGVAIPAFSNVLISSGKVLLATTNVTTFTNLVGATPYCNNVNQINTAFNDALLSFRKRRKQLSRSSYEI